MVDVLKPTPPEIKQEIETRPTRREFLARMIAERKEKRQERLKKAAKSKKPPQDVPEGFWYKAINTIDGLWNKLGIPDDVKGNGTTSKYKPENEQHQIHNPPAENGKQRTRYPISPHNPRP